MTTRTRKRLAVGGLVVVLLAAGVWAGVTRWQREAAREPFVGVWALDMDAPPAGVSACLHERRPDGTCRFVVVGTDGRALDTMTGRWRIDGPELVVHYDRDGYGRPAPPGQPPERVWVEQVDADRLVFARPGAYRVVYRRHPGPLPE